ncbi:MAG: flavodoxin family protein [Candidatus Methanomethylophilaceae archaeon]|nr:flavodoxin family protein [Candidatus Methanomethylophilaceae archaeon]
MSKKMVVINASPRRGWNTDMLVDEAARGAASQGAEIQKFDLYRLDKFTGCISCFGCKREGHKGECICRDGLKPVLDAIRESDGLIVGAPNYFGDLCAEFKLFYERLLFQYLTYRTDKASCNDRIIPVLLIMTSNAPDTLYTDMLSVYKTNFERFIGPTTVFVSGETMQVNDYGKFDWTMFDGEARKARRETVFPKELESVRRLGSEMVGQ